MNWRQAIYDSFYKAYWSANFTGMQSLSAGEKTELGLPAETTYYRRARPISGHMAWLDKQEDYLNIFVDLFFDLAPSRLKAALLRHHGGDEDWRCRRLSFATMRKRYGWGDKNVTQADGFFESASTIVGLEIKIDAATSRDQILKYAALSAIEQIYLGELRETELTYFIREGREDALAHFISDDRVLAEPLTKNEISKYLKKFRPKSGSHLCAAYDKSFAGHLANAARSMKIGWKTWNEVAETCAKHKAGSVNETEIALIDGLLRQLETQIPGLAKDAHAKR